MIRAIERGHNAGVARVIRTVMPSFGAGGAGFAINDAEVDDMFGNYQGARAAYYVVERGDGEVMGGGGYAPLAGGDPDTCELRKMYFLPELRGLGFGRALLERCLEGARAAGFARMYLETLTGMDRAKALYERAGFHAIPHALGATGHFGCDRFYAMDLR